MKRLVLLSLVALGFSAPAQATAITFSTDPGGTLSASVTFDVSGTDLIVTLTNTSTLDALAPVDILTGVYFDVAGSPLLLTPVSAALNTGSSVLIGSNTGLSDPGGVVGGEFAYASGIAALNPEGLDYGISSSGLGIFGSANFTGSNLSGPVAVNGLQYGITSAGDNSTTGNSAVLSNPLIDNSVVFTLSGLPSGFDPSTAITTVVFRYGTSLEDPRVYASEPGSLLLVSTGVALILTGRLRTRRRRAAQQP